ncbi:hypothetical protein M441DRAFT_76485 [Trichoderma asperellum CBS 433.97]|uniref:Secreted protein n=1 Tax=Trichoderma asperellum (strain ATCC 204424 / CBS 433.97 / NBRC 101777) TaxID=1042311 RepID=A0A2T3ZKP8_TRIA4|nr:hypothetical protein M441DRAFT_76485 [Trichoderma asperellum CBS 433.97]PTB45380.1 hypothetical protein M441DRAFT_76485 [Trichoderma asperellum CBS 433.97]
MQSPPQQALLLSFLFRSIHTCGARGGVAGHAAREAKPLHVLVPSGLVGGSKPPPWMLQGQQRTGRHAYDAARNIEYGSIAGLLSLMHSQLMGAIWQYRLHWPFSFLICGITVPVLNS